MFGHTLLVIRGPQRSALLSHAVNYGATTGDDGGIAFAFKGIFGLYPGYFSLLPYYQKVQEYTDMDHRDMWEYDLNLDRDEVERLISHMLELDGISSDYWFFGENCSFNLLYLLDAARPGLGLHRQTRSWVVPADTLKLTIDAGLVVDRHYRPSRTSRARRVIGSLNQDARRSAIALAEGDISADDPSLTSLAVDDQRQAYAFAAEHLQALRSSGDLDQGLYQQRLVPILAARSKLGRSERERMAPPTPPESGHASTRLSIGGGSDSDDGFISAAFRPAYHDLLDPQAGFTAGSEIAFAELELRAYEGDDYPRIHLFDAVRVTSLARRDDIDAPLSYRARLGLRSETIAGKRRRLDGILSASGGMTWGGDQAWGYLLAGIDARVVEGDSNHSVGVTAEAGLRYQITDNWAAHGEAQLGHYPLGVEADTWRLSLDQSWQLSSTWALRLGINRRDTWDQHSTGAAVSALFYF
jgi:hypothetical protein